jgi:hypothetical protein
MAIKNVHTMERIANVRGEMKNAVKNTKKKKKKPMFVPVGGKRQ